VQAQLFGNRNFMGHVVLPDLLAACAPTAGQPEARDGCAALRGWDRTNNLDARRPPVPRVLAHGAAIPGVYRVPFDPAQPVATPPA
jgi:acyl-homoserine-lactone acylase